MVVCLRRSVSDRHQCLTVAIPKFLEKAIDALKLGAPDASAYDFAFAIILSGLAIIVVRTLSRTLFFNPGRTIGMMSKCLV